MAQSILDCVPSNLPSNFFKSVKPYTRTGSTTALKKFLFKVLSKEDLYIVLNLLRL